MDEDRSPTESPRPEEGTGNLVIRILRTTAEFDCCVDLQRRIWGNGFADVVPATLLQITQKVGGLTAGAFLGRDSRLVGFVYGLTGIRHRRLCHWSHMLGVLPEQRGQEIGQKLKHFQRQRVRKLGVKEMLWSFDPLIAGNAHFNINLLNVEIASYEPQMYGDTGSDLHSFGTDRFVARWDLSREDERGDGWKGSADRVDQASVQEFMLANVLPKATGAPSRPVAESTAQRIRIEIPRDILKIKQADPELALEWRHSTGVAFQESTRAGYQVVGFTRLTGTERCAYLLERE